MTNLRAKEAEKAEQMFQRKKFLDEQQADKQFFDSNDFQSTNKAVDNILRTENAEAGPVKAAAAKVNIEEAKWGDDDSLSDLEDDEGEAAPADGAEAGADGTEAVESDIFVPPSPGADPYQSILR